MSEWRRSISVNPQSYRDDEYPPGYRGMPKITAERSHVTVTFTIKLDVPVMELLYLRQPPDYDETELVARIVAEAECFPELMEP